MTDRQQNRLRSKRTPESEDRQQRFRKSVETDVDDGRAPAKTTETARITTPHKDDSFRGTGVY